MNILQLHPKNPEVRKLKICIDHLTKDGVLAFPSHCGYLLLAAPGSLKAVEAIRSLRQVDRHHLFSLIGKDIAQLSDYMNLTTPMYRLIKKYTPSATTFIVDATKVVHKMLLQPKRRTIGVRIPEEAPLNALLSLQDGPLISVGLLKKVDADQTFEPIGGHDVLALLAPHPALLIVEIEPCVHHQTTIIDCTGIKPVLVRHGASSIPL
jgi:tRNA threonylcarbamoyl adenosine modification protein (Sua5/YciO/YrdC/YwlC family)